LVTGLIQYMDCPQPELQRKQTDRVIRKSK
jgi:hypothetical protein